MFTTPIDTKPTLPTLYPLLLPHITYIVPSPGNMQGTTLGKVRAYWLGCVVCLGGFLFGYDSGM